MVVLETVTRKEGELTDRRRKAEEKKHAAEEKKVEAERLAAQPPPENPEDGAPPPPDAKDRMKEAEALFEESKAELAEVEKIGAELRKARTDVTQELVAVRGRLGEMQAKGGKAQ
jgi:hypothetical protein